MHNRGMKEMEIDMGKRKKLRRKMTSICCAFVLILSVTLGLFGVYTYKENIRERYEQYAETIVRITDSYIDIVDMMQCIQTGEKTESYERTQVYLNNIKNRSDVEHLYVIQPLHTGETDNAMYIWDAVTQEEKENYQEISSLGDLSGEIFNGKMAESFMMAMGNGDEVAFYANNTADFGYMLTGMYPLRTIDGQAVALLCVDISMNQINQEIMQYILFVLCETLVVGAVFLFVLLRLVNKSVVSPVIGISHSTEDFVQQSNSEADLSKQADRR